MKYIFLHISALFVLFGISSVFGQQMAAGTVSSASAGFLPLSEVREGMKGTARTVFRGTEPEEFNVEILGVVPGGVGPKQDMIVGRISGGPADRTGVFAGMSGSPVYIGGKLVGAISYSFPFSKEPICGITPIEQMISIFEKKNAVQTASTEPRKYSFGELVSASTQTGLPDFLSVDSGLVSGMSPNSMLMAVAGQAFRPIATPITFSGFSQSTLDRFSPQLLQAGLV
ncbi:MAG: SpoIVB peptidase S55 domain-containing protein, partial [Pyrinomonadaceae bacterium]